MNTTRGRIQSLLATKKWSVTKLAAEIDETSTTKVRLNRQINGETTISVDTIELILATFPDVSAEWLLRGAGNMFIWQSAVEENAKADPAENGEQVENGGVYVSELRQQIAELKKDKENLMLLLTQITKR